MPNRSISLPFRTGTKGFFDTTKNYEENIKLKLRVLFSTEPNSRVMETPYGAGLKRFIFEPNDEQTESKIKKYIVDKVKTYIPELNLTEDDVIVSVDDKTIFVDLNILINGIQQTVKIRINK